MMDHDGARNLMAEALQGELTTAQERELALHLVVCPECKALHEGLQNAQASMGHLASSQVPTRAVEEAIHRASTVLLGEADPGPMAGTPIVPPPSQHLEAPPVAQPSLGELGPPIGELAADRGGEGSAGSAGEEPAPDEFDIDLASAEGLVAAAHPPEPSAEPSEPVEVAAPQPEAAEPDFEPAADPTPAVAARLRDDSLFAPPREPIQMERPVGDDDPPPHVDAPLLPPEHEILDEFTPPPMPPPAPEELEPILSRIPEVDERELIGAETVYSEPPEERPGAGPWLIAITATVLLALLAGYLITKQQGPGGDLPTATEVANRVSRVFSEMKSLRASFVVRRLDLYPVSRVSNSITYKFSDGELAGRIVYDRATGYREQSTIKVTGQEIVRTKIVKTADETGTLIGTGSTARHIVDRNAPLGPPDALFRPSLGSLEQSLGTAAQALIDATDLQVVGLKQDKDREVVEVTFSVEPTELSRADKMVVLLDTRTYFPVHVRREISRTNARVLGPDPPLSDNAIATAFGGRDRVTTEVDDLQDVVVDDIILPGDLVLDVPQGVEAEEHDGGYARVTRADLGSKIGFTPLFPRSLPDGSEQQTLAVATGTPGPWGPGNSYPAPDGTMQVTYFDGKTTIVVTEKHMPDGPFDTKGSPLATGGLPMQTRAVERAAKTFYYASSPDVPPHAYGFLGNVFVVATGYAPASQLVQIVSSMTETPVEGPSPLDVSPSPSSSPGPGASHSPAPTTTPPATAAPTATPAATP